MGKINYKTLFNGDEVILVRKFKGSVTYHDIAKSWDFCLNSGLVTTNMVGVISDYTDAKISDHHSRFEQLLQYFKKHPELKHLRMAAVLDDPEHSYFKQSGIFALCSIDLSAFDNCDDAHEWIAEKVY